MLSTLGLEMVVEMYIEFIVEDLRSYCSASIFVMFQFCKLLCIMNLKSLIEPGVLGFWGRRRHEHDDVSERPKNNATSTRCQSHLMPQT